MNTRTEIHTAPSGEHRVLRLPDWGSFRTDTIVSEVEALHDEGYKLAETIASLAQPTFQEVVLPIEDLNDRMAMVIGPLEHLKGVMSADIPEIVRVADRVSELQSAFSAKMALHVGLYRAYVAIRDGEQFHALSDDEKRIITESIRKRELSGVGLPEDEKAQLTQVYEETARFSTQYENNIQDSTDAWHYVVVDVSELDGVPADDIARMAEEAVMRKEKGWVITLQMPDVMAILMYAKNRALRARVADARREIACHGAYDNIPVSKKILALAHKQAKILGFSQYAELSLEPKMARQGGVAGVQNFLMGLHAYAFPKAQAEYVLYEEFARTRLGITDPAPHDFLFVERLMQEEQYAIDHEALRAYMPFSKAMEAIAHIVQATFGLTLVKRTDVSVWHPSVVFYELRDSVGALRGAFYADMYARKGKRSGAWMDTLTTSRRTKDGTLVPVAFLVSNAPTPQSGQEAYLAHDEIVTLFHEFGHTFHLIAGEPVYRSLSMNHVEWDTVELPSQWMENYAWEPEVLTRMSAHRETGQPLPREMIDRLLSSRHFHTGLSTVRQLRFALYDMKLYSTYDPEAPLDPVAVWHDMDGLDVRTTHPDERMVTNFRHIMSGGYSAGYFSYMWALGLVAQAWEPFAQNPFDREAGRRYHREIIAPGASRPMQESFERFVGPLRPEALSRYLGLS